MTPEWQLTPQEAAMTGPRSLKTPGTPQWCWQTVESLKTSMHLLDNRWREAEEVMDELMKAQAWKIIPPEEPYGTFDELLKKELGRTQRQINALIRKAKLAGHGEIGNGRSSQSRGNIVTSTRGNAETYTLRRLRRDRPELADRVEAGELSSHAAAIEAGFRKRTITIRTDDPAVIAASLRRNLKPNVLHALSELLETG